MLTYVIRDFDDNRKYVFKTRNLIAAVLELHRLIADGRNVDLVAKPKGHNQVQGVNREERDAIEREHKLGKYAETEEAPAETPDAAPVAGQNAAETPETWSARFATAERLTAEAVETVANADQAVVEAQAAHAAAEDAEAAENFSRLLETVINPHIEPRYQALVRRLERNLRSGEELVAGGRVGGPEGKEWAILSTVRRTDLDAVEIVRWFLMTPQYRREMDRTTIRYGEAVAAAALLETDAAIQETEG